MAARVTGEEVKDILDTILSEVELEPFISTATVLVDEEVDTGTVTADRLKQVELYLAAHFACQRDPRARKEGATSVEYEPSDLASSSYGAQALLLDPTGNLAKLGKPDRKQGMFRVAAE